MKQINIKVDVPDGFVLDKIETEGNNIVAFVKKKEKFKRGDVVTLIDHDLSKDSIIIIDEVATNGYWPIGTIGGFTIKSSKININAAYNKCFLANSRLATPSEAQQLFDALAKEGKIWNPETIQIEDIEKDILVPESIGIYKLSDRAITSHDNGDGLYISFNKDKQALSYLDGQYGVNILDNIFFTKVKCKLTPCKREDLRAGDTAFFSETFRLDDTMLFDKGRYVKILINKEVKINKSGEIIFDGQHHNHWYKIEPIN